MHAGLLPQRRSRRISLTALIDVVFILLMFFMLTTGFSQWQALNITVAGADTQSRTDAPVLVLIRDDGSLFLLDEQLRPIRAADALASELPADRPVVISAHKETPVSLIVPVLQSLNREHTAFTLGQTFDTEIHEP